METGRVLGAGAVLVALVVLGAQPGGGQETSGELRAGARGGCWWGWIPHVPWQVLGVWGWGAAERPPPSPWDHPASGGDPPPPNPSSCHLSPVGPGSSGLQVRPGSQTVWG